MLQKFRAWTLHSFIATNLYIYIYLSLRQSFLPGKDNNMSKVLPIDYKKATCVASINDNGYQALPIV